MNKRYIALAVCLLCVVLVLCACGLRKSSDSPASQATNPPVTVVTPTPENETTITALPEEESPAPVETVAPVVTPEPTPVPTPVPTVEPIVTPEPAPVATPVPTPVPNAADLPIIRKSPTDESVVEGGNAYFVARYDNALWAVWHFVSPDGTEDYAYDAAELRAKFPNMEIRNGMYSTMELRNMPLELSGWKVYCQYRNRTGSTNTEKATITVTAQGDVDKSKLPVVTKSPTAETVDAGGSAWFVAKYRNATWAVWHFMSPDFQINLTYKEAAERFPGLQIVGGDQSNLQLKNIPADLNGWSVYCEYTNNFGSVDTDPATITVKGGTPAPTAAPAPASTTDYSGTYVESIAQRGVITITGGPQIYRVHVRWPGSASEVAEWDFSGSFDTDGILRYTGGSKTITTYDGNGNGVMTTSYTDGTGKLVYSAAGNTMYWTDDKEDVANGASFFKS